MRLVAGESIGSELLDWSVMEIQGERQEQLIFASPITTTTSVALGVLQSEDCATAWGVGVVNCFKRTVSAAGPAVTPRESF
ncbi:hypothetical protein CH278_25725 [Rhodococcus sp. 05-2254-5]|nr:hypothetical protein CH278_25725 [Rhodococcus sp. 05-2254-5]OZE58304.1 hypothetical protein CH269_10885 [Rhodococcus sp. 05-2254-1]